MKRALKDIYENAEVYEWFDYGGEPYRFRALIDTTPMREQLNHRQIVEAIETYKPARAWPDYIAYMKRVGIGISVSSRVYRLDYEMCGTQPDISTGLGIHRGTVDARWSGKVYGTETQMTSGNLIAGTEPGVSTGLRIVGESLTAEWEASAYKTQHPMTSEDLAAGTEPGISTGLKTASDGVVSTVTGNAYNISYAMSGDDMP